MFGCLANHSVRCTGPCPAAAEDEGVATAVTATSSDAAAAAVPAASEWLSLEDSIVSSILMATYAYMLCQRDALCPFAVLTACLRCIRRPGSPPLNKSCAVATCLVAAHLAQC